MKTFATQHEKWREKKNGFVLKENYDSEECWKFYKRILKCKKKLEKTLNSLISILNQDPCWGNKMHIHV